MKLTPVHPSTATHRETVRRTCCVERVSRSRQTARAIAVAGALALCVTACGSGDDSASSPTPAPTSAAPATTTLAPSATTEAQATTDAPTTATPTTEAPTTTEGAAPALPTGSALTAGTTYRVARAALGRAAQLTNAVDGAFALSGKGAFIVTQDQGGFEALVVVADLSDVYVVNDPLLDTATLPDIESYLAVSSPAPADYLAWFGTLPGVQVGPAQDATFAGYPARAATWSFGSIEGGHPCNGVDRGNCVTGAVIPFARGKGGYVTGYWSGDSGTTYVVDIDGQQLVVEVQDRPGANEIAASIVFGD